MDVNHYLVQDNGTPSLFRYDIKPNPKVSVLEPAALSEGQDRQNLRATVLGAVAKNHFLKLPKSAMGSVLWEAPWFDQLCTLICHWC